MRTIYLVILYVILMIQPYVAYYNVDKPLFILCAVIMLVIMIGLWYDKKFHDECIRKNSFPMDFTDYTYSLKLYRIISKNFDNNYTTHIITLDHLQMFLKRYDLTEKFYNHLEEPCRIEWVKQKMIGSDKGLYIILLDKSGKEIIATMGFSQYRTLFTDVYPELYSYLKTNVNETINGNTLIVNKDYRGKGIASKLKSLTNAFWLEHFDYVIGNTDNEKAKNLYAKLGAIVAFEEEFEGDNYYYYYWKK